MEKIHKIFIFNADKVEALVPTPGTRQEYVPKGVAQPKNSSQTCSESAMEDP